MKFEKLLLQTPLKRTPLTLVLNTCLAVQSLSANGGRRNKSQVPSIGFAKGKFFSGKYGHIFTKSALLSPME